MRLSPLLSNGGSPLGTFGLPPSGRTLGRYPFHHIERTLEVYAVALDASKNVFVQCGLRRFPREEFR